jgi:hypothetical protein
MALSNQEIRIWLDSLAIKNYTIHEDSVVDVDGDVGLTAKILTTIPIQFGNTFGRFSCANTSLSSLKGSPQTVGDYFSCYFSAVSSLDWAPQSVVGNFDCERTKITSLHNIHKQIKHIGGDFYCDEGVTHLLGLLLIDGITGFHIDGNGPLDKIFHKYRGTGDILSAQDELIDAGFIKQARL